VARQTITYLQLKNIIDLKNRTTQDNDVAEEIKQPEQKQGEYSKIVSWEFPSRTPNISAIIITSVICFVIAALVQIFTRNIITTVFFGMIGLVIMLNSKNKQQQNELKITPAGVEINDTNHPYHEIHSFWIEYEPKLGIKELSLQFKKWHRPYIKMAIEGQDPVQIRLALLEFLPELEHKDSLIEILGRNLGL